MAFNHRRANNCQQRTHKHSANFLFVTYTAFDAGVTTGSLTRYGRLDGSSHSKGYGHSAHTDFGDERFFLSRQSYIRSGNAIAERPRYRHFGSCT